MFYYALTTHKYGEDEDSTQQAGHVQVGEEDRRGGGTTH